MTSNQQTPTAATASTNPDMATSDGQNRSVSCVADTSTQREVVVECFAPYDDHRQDRYNFAFVIASVV
jgi:hypothetical protein